MREAVIFSSLMRKVSLNVLHAAAALLRLADMDYNGRTALHSSPKQAPVLLSPFVLIIQYAISFDIA